MGQRINPNAMNGMQMKNMSSMMGVANAMQRIGKGKRKYGVSLEKGQKKLLGKFIEEVKKQFTGQENNPQMKGVSSFLNYLQAECNKKEAGTIKMSYDELDFVKRMLSDSVKGMDAMSFKWYQFIKKGTVKLMNRQYKELLEIFKK